MPVITDDLLVELIELTTLQNALIQEGFALLIALCIFAFIIWAIYNSIQGFFK